MEGKTPYSSVLPLTCLNHFDFYADVDGVENHNIDLFRETKNHAPPPPSLLLNFGEEEEENCYKEYQIKTLFVF
jgi:hypothetical protein